MEVYEMERERSTRATRFGQWAGRQWCRYVQREVEAIHWLRGKGLPGYFASALALSTRLILIALVLIPVVSLAAIIAIAYVPAKCVGNSTQEPEAQAVGDSDDHKKSVFYDPINFNDPDDPRFDD
ncbi:DUF3742 family protein [Pseudomonas sp. LB3P25]